MKTRTKIATAEVLARMIDRENLSIDRVDFLYHEMKGNDVEVYYQVFFRNISKITDNRPPRKGGFTR